MATHTSPPFCDDPRITIETVTRDYQAALRRLAMTFPDRYQFGDFGLRSKRAGILKLTPTPSYWRCRVFMGLRRPIPPLRVQINPRVDESTYPFRARPILRLEGGEQILLPTFLAGGSWYMVWGFVIATNLVCDEIAAQKAELPKAAVKRRRVKKAS